MKSVSAALAAHLAGPVTTLATCWRITRRDGREFFFTDHDRDLVFEGEVYKASSGYSRTAIANDSSLGVDNLDVEGVFDTQAITEEELRAGLFDQAEVRIFLVNWADPSMGSLRMRRGWFGEVVLTEQGVFRTELRGMTQALSQRIGELYSPECRADLGDDRCKVPIHPPEIQRSAAYAMGDIVRVRTSSAPATIGISFVNPGFDAGDLSGWTLVSGSASAKTSNGALGPKTGTHFLEGGSVSSFEVRQTVDLAGALDPATTDGGSYLLTVGAWRANGGGDTADQGRVRVELLDDAGAVLATPLDTGNEAMAGVWTLRQIADAPVPAGTRQLRVVFSGTRVSGTVCNAALDGVSGYFTDTTTAVGTAAVYENRIYRCVAAGSTAAVQPAYDTGVGQQTTDGSAVFETMEAWSRAGLVTDVVDRAVFTASIDEPRAADGWFAGGVLTWESGPNAGRSIEIKAWTQATGRIELFLPMGYAVRVGDLFRIHPGCDKRLDTCIDRFANVLNFRGEPYVPGQDAMMSYPDAR